jgi:hypothetical protein
MNKQTFHARISEINPEGDISSAYELLGSLIQYGKKVNDKPLGFDLVLKKYSDYVTAWNRRFAKKEQSGYLAKKDALKNIYEFINEKLYEQSFIIGNINVKRDLYLFGGNIDKLYERSKQSKEVIETERSKFIH